MQPDNRVALITGACGGIGAAYAHTLAARGCRVVLADSGHAASDTPKKVYTAALTASAIVQGGGQAVSYFGDITMDSGEMIACAVDAFGQLDILINNAGPLGSFTLFSDNDVEAWQRVSRVHYEGTVAVTRAAWPHLAASGTGRVINTASTAMLGSERQSDYGSAKAALFGLTRALATEGRAVGINVNCVLPSAFTRMMELIQHEGVREATRRIFGPEHVAAFVAWLVHADTRVTGEAFNIGGGRASRVVLATGPAIVIPNADSDAQADAAPRLFEGSLTEMTTMLENFASEMVDIDPSMSADMQDFLALGIST
ncbi:SDR family NAD(P)-dependent oxidoreductase [Actinomycetes bacterium M1A6_2h]